MSNFDRWICGYLMGNVVGLIKGYELPLAALLGFLWGFSWLLGYESTSHLYKAFNGEK